jgi:TPR repeat protein
VAIAVDAVLDWLRWLEELAVGHQGLLLLIATIAAVLALLPLLKPLFKRRRGRCPSDPELSDAPLADRSLTRYSARAVELLGRDEAMARLRAFLGADGGFLWMQVAGVGGQGKSRLGWELTLWARERGWQAGLLERVDLDAFAKHWPTWRPRRPHLLVLDYVIGREATIKPVLQTLAGRAAELRKPVRLLLLERQRWDRGGLGALGRVGDAGTGLSLGFGFDGRAEWFLRLAERPDGNDPRLETSRFEDGVLELTRLSDADLVAIVRRIAELGGALLTQSDDSIAEQLRHIDSDGRPLYPYFLGQALADGADPSAESGAPGWRREDLLNATLERDRNTRWRECLGEDAPCLGDGSLPERLAVIATIAGGLDCAAAARQGLIDHADADTRRRALVLADGPLGTGVGGPSQVIPPLMPDLLAAWFVLSACEQGLPTGEVLNLAWRYSPEQTAAFLLRVSQDFPEHPRTQALLEHAPPDEPSQHALARAASKILLNLNRGRHDVWPETILTSLQTAGDAGDATAITHLGFCYEFGKGVEPNMERAFLFYYSAAVAGHGLAMARLGHCYARGVGVDKDISMAVHWYREGAGAGDSEAMRELSGCYRRGEGVDPDGEQYIYWLRQSSERGNKIANWILDAIRKGKLSAQDKAAKSATAGNGIRPTGVTPGEIREALISSIQSGGLESLVFQPFIDRNRAHRENPGATEPSGSDASAMAQVGTRYQNGLGLDPDPSQAVDSYVKAAHLGDGLSMSRLGMCYEQGHGVEQNFSVAVDWYRKGAAAGDGLGMTRLGICYEYGMGVTKDVMTALGWYQRGAVAGNGTAMLQLGIIYAEGIGVDRDAALAANWYRNAAAKGEVAAMANLGTLYLGGAGIDPDPLRALAWYVEGAARGDARAMTGLGVCYQEGFGVDADAALALDWYRRGAAAGDSTAMFNLGVCYQEGLSVERDLAVALEWYRKSAKEGNGAAMANLRVLEAAESLLRVVSSRDLDAEYWAQTVAVRLNTVEWRDAQLVLEGWQDLDAADATSMIAPLHAQLPISQLGDVLSTASLQRLRGTALAFYPNCWLLDLQLQQPKEDSPLLCSALVSPGGAALLDGTSPLLLAINPKLLQLADDDTASDYLRFFCTFVRGEDGPFRIIDTLDDLPLVMSGAATVEEGFLSPIRPLQAIDGDLVSDGWRRFEGCVLYGDGIFRSTFKVHATGMVEMEGDVKIAADLPIRTRRYDGIFRTPLLAPGEE